MSSPRRRRSRGAGAAGGKTASLLDRSGAEVLRYADLYVVGCGRQGAPRRAPRPGGALAIWFDDAGRRIRSRWRGAALEVIVARGGIRVRPASERNGSPCASAAECESGFCADGVCCNAACNAARATLAPWRPAPPSTAPAPCSRAPCATTATPARRRTRARQESARREPGRVRRAGPVPRGRHLQPLHGRVLEPGEGGRSKLQRRQRLHADRHVPGRSCTGANPVVCAAQDQCHEAGTCNPATGACSSPVKADGASCIDGNACTQTDTCQAGVCTGANPVVCAAQDQCHEAGTCNPATGACSSPAKADERVHRRQCLHARPTRAGRSCTGANPVCARRRSSATRRTCDAATGVCWSNPAKADGSACTGGSCQAGTCTAAPDAGSPDSGDLEPQCRHLQPRIPAPPTPIPAPPTSMPAPPAPTAGRPRGQRRGGGAATPARRAPASRPRTAAAAARRGTSDRQGGAGALGLGVVALAMAARRRRSSRAA